MCFQSGYLSVQSFWFSTGHEAHHIDYQKPALFQKIITWWWFKDNWQLAVLDHTFIYLFGLIWSTERHTDSSQVPSFFLSVPGTGWKLCLHPCMRVSQRKEKSGITAPSQGGRRFLRVGTCRAFHISLPSPKNDPGRAAACKWTFLWKVMLDLPLHFYCLNQMAPNSPPSGMGGVKNKPQGWT